MKVKEKGTVYRCQHCGSTIEVYVRVVSASCSRFDDGTPHKPARMVAEGR